MRCGARILTRFFLSRWLLGTLKTRYVILLAFLLIFTITTLYRDKRILLNTEDCTLGNTSLTVGNSFIHLGDTCLHFRLMSFHKKDTALNIYMGLQWITRSPKVTISTNILNLTFESCTLTISHQTAPNGEKYSVNWTCEKSMTVTNAISLKDGHWYGGTVTTKQLWPIEQWRHPLDPYVTHDSFLGQYGGLMERYWLSSKGVVLVVDNDVPLFVGFSDDRNLVLQTKWEKPFTNIHDKHISLSYTIYQSHDIMSVHKMASAEVFGRPTNIPKEDLFRHPIWSTWMVFMVDVSQIKVHQFAKDIVDHGFKISQLEIDDKWSKSYGDFEWDPCKFPQPNVMVQELKNMNIPVTLWVHPFASVSSKAASNDLWVKRGGFMPDFFIWWEGIGYALDLTNARAVEWFLSNLNKFKSIYGIHSFKFDGGEANWLPSNPIFSKPLQDVNEYTRLYAIIAAQADTDIRAQEVRVGVRTQHLPMFIRLMDKKPMWSNDNGLQSLIPNVLTYSILGYPFVLPDLIGGNSYFTDRFPSKELYIRWAQVCTFFPVMQFSLPPWNYDEETVQITRDLTRLHEFYSELLINLAKNFLSTGDPIIRPLWWIAPLDETALTIDSQFLVGNDFLVAPVVREGATSRDVYLPSGRWRDMRGAILNGGLWYTNYSAELHELPYFRRIN